MRVSLLCRSGFFGFILAFLSLGVGPHAVVAADASITVKGAPIFNVPTGGSAAVTFSVDAGLSGATVYFTGSFGGEPAVENPVGQRVVNDGAVQTFEYVFDMLREGLNAIGAQVVEEGDFNPYNNTADAVASMQNDPVLRDLIVRAPWHLIVKNDNGGDTSVSQSKLLIEATGVLPSLGVVTSAEVRPGEGNRVLRFPAGASVTVTAVAGVNEEFVSWLGGPCTGTICTPFVGAKSSEEVNVPIIGTFKKKSVTYQTFSFTQKGKVGTTLVPGKTTISYNTGTTTAEFVCTGNTCPGKPSKLPTGTTITAIMEQERTSDNGNEQYVANSWGAACAGKSKSGPCVVTVGTSALSIEATHKTKYKITLKRANNTGKVWANTTDSQDGVQCSDATDCAAGTGNKAYWFLQDKQINIYAEGETGHRFKGWFDACSTAQPGYCTFKATKALTVGATFEEALFWLKVEKDCNAGLPGKLADGKYCGTMSADIYVNGTLRAACGATCGAASPSNQLRRDIDTWIINRSPLQGSVIAAVQCFAESSRPWGTEYYNCVPTAKTDGGYRMVITSKVDGREVSPLVTKLAVRYSPRADYDVDPIALVPSRDGQILAVDDGLVPATDAVATQAGTMLKTVLAESSTESSPSTSFLRALMGTLHRATGNFIATLARPVQHVDQQFRGLMAAVSSLTEQPNLSAYYVVTTPRLEVVRLGTPVRFYGAVGNTSDAPFTGSYRNVIGIQKEISYGVWNNVFSAVSTTTSTIAGQTYAFYTPTGTWTPTQSGNYRVRYCARVLTGGNAIESDDCSYFRPFFVAADTLGVCGDANRSGTVTSTDALLVLKYAVGDLTTSINALNADVNGDGVVVASDAQTILNASVGAVALTKVNGACTVSTL